MPRRGPWFLVLLLLAVATAVGPAADPACDRVVAIGDLHGGYDALVQILGATKLVDSDLRLIDGRACLVQLGDVLDRGARSRDVLDLLMALRAQAPERVEILLGNHEAMTLVSDLRYAVPEEFQAFAAEGEPVDLDEGLPSGWFARHRAFSSTGVYGKWLLERPAVARFGDSVFVHGGLTPAEAQKGVASVRAEVDADLRGYVAAREALEVAGWLAPTDDFSNASVRVTARLEAAGADDPARAAAETLLRLQGSGAFVDPEGPLWYRGLAQLDDDAVKPQAFAVLAALSAERIVVAHTTTADFRIVKRAGGHVFLIDTGAGPAYGGRPSALEIAADGTVDAVYVDGRERLVDRPLTDAEWEDAMSHGEIVKVEEIGTGITKPKRVTLTHNGRTVRAAFKAVEIQEKELTRFATSGGQFQFTDSWHFERPAYLLDRKLGMNMTPPVVEREVEGTRGALVAWVENAINEQQRQERKLDSPDPTSYARQHQVMRVFDALIGNPDRNLGNQLTTTWDFRLHLIDHTRAFVLTRTLSEPFEKEAVALPRSLYDAIRALDPKTVEALLDGMVSGARVKAMFVRRDRLVEKIERQVRDHGEALVFHGP
jgi:Calcineurin-like phosphoesterase